MYNVSTSAKGCEYERSDNNTDERTRSLVLQNDGADSQADKLCASITSSGQTHQGHHASLVDRFSNPCYTVGESKGNGMVGFKVTFTEPHTDTWVTSIYLTDVEDIDDATDIAYGLQDEMGLQIWEVQTREEVGDNWMLDEMLPLR